MREDDLRRSLEQFVATTAPLDPDNILDGIMYHGPNGRSSRVSETARQNQPTSRGCDGNAVVVNTSDILEEDSSAVMDDLSGRPSLGGSRVVKKKFNDTSYQTFSISENVLMFTKRQLRNERDPNSDSFMVINFRRMPKDSKQTTATSANTKGKPYDFNIYEYLAMRLLQALLVFIGSRVPGQIEVPAFENLAIEDHDGKRSVNMIKWGQDK